MGWCQAEFADLLLQALAKILTDGWTFISSNWWCQLGMLTFLSFQVEDKYSEELYNFFLLVSLVSLCEESLRGQFIPQEMEERSSVHDTVDILSADGFYNC